MLMAHLRLAFIYCVVFCFLCSAQISAKQVYFSQQAIEQSRLFSYQWQDINQDAQTLQFSIPNKTIRQMPSTGAAYHPQLAQRAIKSQLLAYAKTIDPRMAKINIKQQGAQINISVTANKQGVAQEITDKLGELQKQAQMEYLQNNFYLPFKNHYGQKAIKHDHARYAQLSVEGTQAIVEAIKKSIENPNDFREFINFTLSWIQSIPYNTLEDRVSSNGSGFASPRELIISNQGDCDSKSTLMATIIKAYAPNADVRMIFLPQHALLGIKMKPNKKDRSIKIGRKDFVLLEPTGPAFYMLGEIAPSSSNSLRNRQYTSEKM
jgi:hypothetical protein